MLRVGYIDIQRYNIASAKNLEELREACKSGRSYLSLSKTEFPGKGRETK